MKEREKEELNKLCDFIFDSSSQIMHIVKSAIKHEINKDDYMMYCEEFWDNCPLHSQEKDT